MAEIIHHADKKSEQLSSSGLNTKYLQFLLDSIDGAICCTEINSDQSLQITYISNGLYSYMRRTPSEVGEHGENILSLVYSEDYDELVAKTIRASINHTVLDHVYRVSYDDGNIEWRHIHGIRLPDEPDHSYPMIHLITNISNRELEREALQEKDRIVDFAMRNTDINFWYFNMDTKICLQGENCQNAHEMTGEPELHNFPDCLFEMGYVREDSIEPLRKAYNQLWETGENVEFDAWFRKADGSGWWCERDMLTAVTGPDGKVMRGIGIGKNVTAEKELEEKYWSFHDYKRLAERNAIVSFHLNLTKSTLVECMSQQLSTDLFYQNYSVDSLMELILKYIAGSDDLKQCTEIFSRVNLLKRFNKGETLVELEYRSVDLTSQFKWIKTTIEMMKNPITGDVEAFLFSFDIDYEKNMSLLVKRLLDADYEFLGLIDTAKGTLQIFCSDRWEGSAPPQSSSYDATLKNELKQFIQEEYYDESIRTMNLAHIVQELKEKEYYICSFPAKESQLCRAGQKQWKFAYLDSSHTRILLSRTDITDIYTAEYDPLTGLYNRQAFYRYVRAALLQNPDQTFIMIRCDIDRFKAYNDTYGTQAGDRLLAGFGRAARQQTWEEPSIFSRVEADHFCVFMPKAALDTSVWQKMHQDWLAGAAPGYHLTTSMGIYEITKPDIEVSLMCDRALLALSTVKENYLGKIAWYDEQLRDQLIEEQILVDDMKSALEREEFIIYFQPQIRYPDYKLIGMEALVRWQHPTKGLIPPGAFIPLFEKNGFIMKLDYYVWEKSCAFIRKSLDLGGPLSEVPVSVNISRSDLYNPELTQNLIDLIAKYNLPAQLLCLEITESAYMEDTQQLITIVSELRNLGFIVEMDDFGTGYSSLTMLKDAPVDVLKLDMMFLNDLDSDHDQRGGIILASVIQLAANLTLPLIAEGIETRTQADYLKKLGCKYMQGYYFSRPIPEEEIRSRFSDGYWKPEH